MSQVVSVLATTGWDVATSVGTIAAAVATLGAVVAALWIGRKDRQAADESLRKQQDHFADSWRRDHQVSLLLEMNANIAKWIAYSSDPAEREALATMHGLYASLPEDVQREMVALTRLIGIRVYFSELTETFEEKYPEIDPDDDPLRLAVVAQREVTARLQALGAR